MSQSKWQLAEERARKTARWATTMTRWRIAFATNGRRVGAKAVAPTRRWELVGFPGPKGRESRGIVDLVAIRKNHGQCSAPFNRGDLLDMVLIQIKGGSARMPTVTDIRRLRAVQKRYAAKAVLLAAWKRGAQPTFLQLKSGKTRVPALANWVPVDPGLIFR